MTKKMQGSEAKENDKSPHYKEMWVAILNLVCVLVMCYAWEDTQEGYAVQKSASIGINLAVAQEIHDFHEFWTWFLAVVDKTLPRYLDELARQQMRYNSSVGSKGDFYYKDLENPSAPHHPARKPSFGYIQNALRLVLPIQLTQTRSAILARDNDATLRPYVPTKFAKTEADYVVPSIWPDPKVVLVKYKSAITHSEALVGACHAVIDVEVPKNQSVSLENYTVLAKLASVRATRAGQIGISLTHSGNTSILLPFKGKELQPLYSSNASMSHVCEAICEETPLLQNCFFDYSQKRKCKQPPCIFGCEEPPCIYEDTALYGPQCTTQCMASYAFSINQNYWNCALQKYKNSYSASFCVVEGLRDACFHQPAALHGDYYFTDKPKSFDGAQCFGEFAIPNAYANDDDMWNKHILLGGVNNMITPQKKINKVFAGTSEGLWTFKITYQPDVNLVMGEFNDGYCAVVMAAMAELKFMDIQNFKKKNATNSTNVTYSTNGTDFANATVRRGAIPLNPDRRGAKPKPGGGAGGQSGAESGDSGSANSGNDDADADISGGSKCGPSAEEKAFRRRRSYTHYSTTDIVYRGALPGLYQDKFQTKQRTLKGSVKQIELARLQGVRLNTPISGSGWHDACLVQQDWESDIFFYNEVTPSLPMGLVKLPTCPHGQKAAKAGFTETATLTVVSQQEYFHACHQVKTEYQSRLRLLAMTAGLTSATEVLDMMFKCVDAYAKDPRILHTSSVLNPNVGFSTYIDTTQDIQSALLGFINAAMLSKMEWLDAHTRQWEVSFFLYSPEINTIIEARVTFQRDVFGYVKPNIIWNINRLSFYTTASDYSRAVIEILVVLGTLGTLCSEIYDIFFSAVPDQSHSKGNQMMARLEDYMHDMWNVIDLIRLLMLLALIGIRIVYMAKCSTAADSIGLDKGPSVKQISDTSERLREIEELSATLRICEGFVLLAFVAWILKYFRHPRLKVFQDTLVASGKALSHYLFVFVIIFTIYVAMGNVFFGRSLVTYSSFGKSFETCFLIVMGAFDYEVLQNAFPMGSGLFFWTFQLFIVMLMLNTIIGIVCAAYDEATEASEEGGKARSIYADWFSSIMGGCKQVSGMVMSRGKDDMDAVGSCSQASENDGNDCTDGSDEDGKDGESANADENAALLALQTLSKTMNAMKEELDEVNRRLHANDSNVTERPKLMSESTSQKGRNQKKSKERDALQPTGNGVEIELLGSALEFAGSTNGTENGQLGYESAQYSVNAEDLCIVKL